MATLVERLRMQGTLTERQYILIDAALAVRSRELNRARWARYRDSDRGRECAHQRSLRQHLHRCPGCSYCRYWTAVAESIAQMVRAGSVTYQETAVA